ncbi:hypothetical protein, partial [Bacillus altitudinis]|uniref:hypothetical protein n=1 Tax=Bacillus altitudinis TaxID=293387 RepID=UPI001C930A7F
MRVFFRNRVDGEVGWNGVEGGGKVRIEMKGVNIEIGRNEGVVGNMLWLMGIGKDMIAEVIN